MKLANGQMDTLIALTKLVVEQGGPPSFADLVAVSGYHRNTVKYSLLRLEDYGLVTRVGKRFIPTPKDMPELQDQLRAYYTPLLLANITDSHLHRLLSDVLDGEHSCVSFVVATMERKDS